MPEPVEGTSPYLPGLDGLRAIAVLAVIGYHLDPAWVPGGLLGVGVFFVLSGYLITDLLVAGYHKAGRIELRQFWARRARRLLPALFVMLFVTLGWVTLFDHAQLPGFRGDLLPAIFYVSNWWFIFHHVSYFARFGPPSALGHLWSLAIEEQFYLVWPFVVLAGLRFVRSKKALIAFTLLVAVASAVEMGLLYSPDGNPTRVYDGTDTRAFALLIGAALALALPRARTLAPVGPGARRLLEVTGAVALVGLFVMFWQTSQYEPFLYQGGMVLLSALSATVIAVTLHPSARLHVLLGWRPLRWVGARSYAIYLWHYPVIVLTTPIDSSPDFVRAALQVSASLVLAALSWRFVEEPVRHGALGRIRARVSQHVRERGWSRPSLSRLGWAASALVAANVVVCVVGLSGVLQVPGAQLASEASRYHDILPPVHPYASRPHGGARSGVAGRGGSGRSGAGRGGAWRAGSLPSSTTTAPVPAGQGVTAIGDSIMVDAAPYLERSLPGIVIDARVGQQLYQVQDEVPQLKANGDIGNRVIIELGTNGPFSPGQLLALLASLGPMRRVVLVNTRVDRPWEQQVNATIASVAATYPHARLVDWYSASAPYPQYFYPDGVHLDPAGARYYASLIVDALEAPPRRSTRPGTPTTALHRS